MGIVRSFLSDRTQQVLLDGEKSSQLPVVSGVPQWSVLEPFCFWYSSMTFQHQFHLKLDFSQMTVYCTGTYTQRKTVKSCKKTYIALKSGRKRGVWNSTRDNVTRCLLQEQDHHLNIVTLLHGIYWKTSKKQNI